MPNASISELHNISYTVNNSCLVWGVQNVHMQDLLMNEIYLVRSMNDQPLKTEVKQLQGLRVYGCPS